MITISSLLKNRIKLYTKKVYVFFSCAFLILNISFSQTEQDSLMVVPTPQMNSLNRSASKLSKKLKESKSDKDIALEYEALAKELITNNEYEKAEDYLNRAKDIYTKNKEKKKMAAVNRELAKLKEKQHLYKLAISLYEEAGNQAKDDFMKQLNDNDANRLRNITDPVTQSAYIQSNIDLLEERGTNEEKVVAYQQMAENQMQQDKTEVAFQNFKKALDNIEEKTEEIKIKGEMAKAYASKNQYSEALRLNEQLVDEARQMNDVKAEIEQLRSLSSLYFSENNISKGLESLMKSYELAISHGQTFEAKKSLEDLAGYYQRNNQYYKSIELYQDFLHNLERTIQADSSLVDNKLFQVTEERIRQLETERILNDELIRGKNILNYVLIASVFLMLVLLVFIIHTLNVIKKRNKKIALQSLRREMNPHFIFNSLNSVNQFIARNDELEANKYLTSYSRLMRNIMENSNNDFIRLSKEMEQLKEYLDLEYLRFADKFTYKIDIEESMDTEAAYVPTMLIQPYLENAIWHGLRYLDHRGLLQLQIRQIDDMVIVRIEDNGIGLKRSGELRTMNQKLHQSRGLNNISERIRLLNDVYHIRIQISMKEKNTPETGVIVEMSFPFIHPATIK